MTRKVAVALMVTGALVLVTSFTMFGSGFSKAEALGLTLITIGVWALFDNHTKHGPRS